MDRRISLAGFHPNNIFGFPDNFFNDTEKQSYPPTNILVSPEKDEVRIKMAVAGFTREDIVIEEEDNRLIVSGHCSKKNDDDWSYEMRNFAMRDFRRAWVKKATFTVSSATLENGVLIISLKKNRENIRQIPVLSAESEQWDNSM